MLLTTWRLRHEFDAAHIDVFSGPSFLWAEAVAGLLRALGRPYVLTLHGGNLPAFGARWPGRLRRLLASAAAVTSPSRYLCTRLQRFSDRILHLPNGIDAGAYPHAVRLRAAPQLVWLRSFHEIYDPVLAVDAAGRLAAELPALRLRMYGAERDGTRAAALRAARRAGIEGRVEIGARIAKADVPARLSEGDIFLNTATIDNTPVSVIEALACGLCVVSTDVGGIPYLLEHETDALLVPPGDGGAMASAVRRLIADPALAERLSRNARAKAEQFDFSIVLPQWRALLGSLATTAR
jgi:glycosyltransferase involved in cell wall biosynthesis